ncbi:MAG: small multi-drug export protein [Eubacteriales bacterium]
MRQYLYIFLIALLPVIELRGAIPVGAGMGLHWLPNALVSVLGNMLPVPFILLFIRLVLDFMKTRGILPRFVDWLEHKAAKGAAQIEGRALVGLCIFVALPLPGTGAWTGALAASLLGMHRGRALAAIFAGVLLAAVLVSLISYGVLNFLSFIL